MPAKVQNFHPRQYMQRGTYEIFRYKDPYLREVALHHHDFYEVYFFLSGSVQYNIESRSYLLTPGDVLLISPLELHQPVFGAEHVSYERIVLWINKPFLESLSSPQEDLSACFDTGAPGHSNLLRPDEPVRQALLYQLEQLLLESQTDQYCGRLCALSYLVQALVLLNRQTQRQARQLQTRAVSGSAVYRAMHYINNHYSENVTLDLLASKFFISKYHLSREFARLTGTSVHRYIIQKRLVMAKQMLRDGHASTEVYQQCGFGDYSNFYRAFKAEYQITPREYIARLKQAQPRSEEMGWLSRERGPASTAPTG